MRPFDYADNRIDGKELAITVASTMTGVAILTLPRLLAGTSLGLDGLISLLLGGLFFGTFAFISAKLASSFPQHNVFEYFSKIVSRPAAVILILGLSLMLTMVTALETRVIGNVANFYFYERTPMEVASFVFLLVVIYGVSGSRAGLIRLNLLFLPIVIVITMVVQFFNINFFEAINLKPILQTDFTQLLAGARQTTLSLTGYVIVLLYVSLMRNPEKAAKMTVIGFCVPLGLYLLIYVFCIGVFSNILTANITYPTIEIAKEVEVPGKFFDRFESIFFTVWVMTIFTSAAIAFDAGIFGLQCVFPKVSKMRFIVLLGPLIFVIAMAPKDELEIQQLGEYIAYAAFFYAVIIPSILYIVAIFSPAVQCQVVNFTKLEKEKTKRALSTKKEYTKLNPPCCQIFPTGF